VSVFNLTTQKKKKKNDTLLGTAELNLTSQLCKKPIVMQLSFRTVPQEMLLLLPHELH
jgi:hypothetical protein